MLVLRTSSNLFDWAALQLLDAIAMAYNDIIGQSTSMYIRYTCCSIVSTDIMDILI